jgi:starvation-inducible DNA-binding protein
MYQTSHDLKVGTRKKVVDMINVHLACTIDLYSQIKQAHWNVRGSHFISLHELFDEIAEAVEKFVDTLAERIMALGGYSKGTIAAVAKTSTLAPYPLTISDGDDHLKAVAKALATVAKSFRQAIEQSDQLGDAGTADMYTTMTRELDQYLWFIEAHLYDKYSKP